MSKRTLRDLVVVIIGVVLTICLGYAFPPEASAQTTPLVVCGIDNPLECEFCHVFALIDRLIKFGIMLAIPIAAILFTYAGVLYFTSGMNSENIGKAKGIFANAAIGFVIALLGFFIVETLLNVLVKGNAFNWKGVQCGANRVLSTGVERTGGVSQGIAATGATGGSGAATNREVSCPTCVAMDASIPGASRSASCAGQVGGACQVDADLNERLKGLTADLKGKNLTWQTTEAWPPTVVHQNACHRSGTCIDAGFTGGSGSAFNIQTFKEAAAKNNLSTVYEVKTEARKADLLRINPKLTSSDVMVVPGINGEHFSVYKK